MNKTNLSNLALSNLTECKKCACFNLRKAARSITQTYDNALQPIDLRVTQFTLLAIAQIRGKLSITETADLMAMDRTTLTRNLKPLEKRALLSITPGHDRRTRMIAITREGKELLSRSFPLWQETQRRVVENFSDPRFESLLTDLNDIVQVT